MATFRIRSYTLCRQHVRSVAVASERGLGIVFTLHATRPVSIRLGLIPTLNCDEYRPILRRNAGRLRAKSLAEMQRNKYDGYRYTVAIPCMMESCANSTLFNGCGHYYPTRINVARQSIYP